jgi:hypothetical protein
MTAILGIKSFTCGCNMGSQAAGCGRGGGLNTTGVALESETAVLPCTLALPYCSIALYLGAEDRLAAAANTRQLPHPGHTMYGKDVTIHLALKSCGGSKVGANDGCCLGRWWAPHLCTECCLAAAAGSPQPHQHHALVVRPQQLQRTDEDVEALRSVRQIGGGADV